MPRLPHAVFLLLLATALPCAADEEAIVEIVLEFPEEPLVYRHRVEEVVTEGTSVRRWSVEARIEYRVLERHPVEGARIEAVLRSARWAGPEGGGTWTAGPAPLARFEVAGGG